MLLQKKIQIYLKTTETCNLNCLHCFTSGSKGQRIFFNPKNTFHFLAGLVDRNALDAINVVLHGGEPMLSPLEDLIDIIENIQKIPIYTQFGIQTNLVYKLTEEKLNFFNKYFKAGMGTSWDYNIRFGSVSGKLANSQEELWRENVKTLVKHGHEITLFVSLNSNLIENKKPKEIVEMAIELGIKYIQFERITEDGNAKENQEYLPENEKVDNWFVELYRVYKENKYHEKIKCLFLSELAEAYLKANHVGNRLRCCEKSIITLNADGSISGCPNSAKTALWGKLADGDKFLTNEKRITAMVMETQRHQVCMSCEVKEICNGDCYKLAWDERCPAPKNLMKLFKTEENIYIENLL